VTPAQPPHGADYPQAIADDYPPAGPFSTRTVSGPPGAPPSPSTPPAPPRCAQPLSTPLAATIATTCHDPAQYWRVAPARVAGDTAHAREVEHLADLDPPRAAVTALRTRILGRFAELETEPATITKQLQALASETSHSQQPVLLDTLPMIGDQLAGASDRLAAQLYAAFDLQLLYSKELHQVTIHAVITPSTPATLAAIIADSETPDAPVTVTSQAGLSVLEPHPIRGRSSVIMRRAGIRCSAR